ncbi:MULTISPECIES: hypothetical protein [unclassified Acidiphilium]|uniref:hypothetical protein n=1 Tax=unclassified Acidiphilium TaxID=2617493 RepID=UPI000BC486D0|nr:MULTISPECIES: hypothetical protein [unclassified Acidiphilium]OYV54349.1 MAG: hypothetical protein B7Z76_14785 [Acidiphilium sp. 20-67-58]OYV84619.1 MAG: hypothetical protein B7Z64_07405 [Acidiphilium sp. 21-68-69]HQT62602.1 hypothetical protein [Acidiphilium sp.]
MSAGRSLARFLAAKGAAACMLTVDEWTMLGTWAAPAISALGFLLIRNQLKGDREALETQTSWEIYNVGGSILQTFISHPECRPYFYDGLPLPEEEPLRSRVLAVNELICDHMENIILHRDAIDAETYQVWVVYMQGLYNRSPTMRWFLDMECEGYRYSRQLLDLLDEGLRKQVGQQAWLVEQRDMAAAAARASSGRKMR